MFNPLFAQNWLSLKQRLKSLLRRVMARMGWMRAHQHQSLSSSLARNKRKLTQNRSAQLALEKKFKVQERALTVSVSSGRVLQNRVEALLDTREQLDKELSFEREQIEDLKTSLKLFEHDQIELQARLDELQQENTDLQADLQKAERGQIELQGRFDELATRGSIDREKLNQYEELLGELVDFKDVFLKNSDKLSLSQAEHLEQIQRLVKKTSGLSKEVRGFRSQHDKQQQKISQFQKREQLLSSSMVSMERRKSDEVARLRSSLQRLRGERTAEENLIDELALRSEIDALSLKHKAKKAVSNYNSERLTQALREGRVELVAVGSSILFADYDAGNAAVGVIGDQATRVAELCGVREARTVTLEASVSRNEPGDLDLLFVTHPVFKAKDPAGFLEGVSKALADGGKLILLGDYLSEPDNGLPNPDAAPVGMMSLLPNWRLDHLIYAGRGRALGVEVIDLNFARIIKPPEKTIAPLIIPPVMSSIYCFSKP